MAQKQKGGPGGGRGGRGHQDHDRGNYSQQGSSQPTNPQSQASTGDGSDPYAQCKWPGDLMRYLSLTNIRWWISKLRRFVVSVFDVPAATRWPGSIGRSTRPRILGVMSHDSHQARSRLVDLG